VRRFPYRFAIWVVFAVLLAVSAASAQRREGVDEAAEQRMVQLINRERAQRGLSTLVVDDRLTRAAREHTRLLIKNKDLEHQFRGEPVLELRLSSTGIRFDSSGENLALDSEGADSAHVSLMHSPPHRANILRPEFSAVGVGAIWSGGVLYVTEDFAHRVSEMTVGEVESAVAQAINERRRAARSPMLTRVEQPKLRDWACDMARDDQLNTTRPHSLERTVNVVAFTINDMARMPNALNSFRTLPASKLAVGACYAKSRSYSTPLFWVLAVAFR
jgi:hypothetical protein